MTKKRFPADWAAAEMLKQYMKNHRRYAVRMGRMEGRAARRKDNDRAEDPGLPNLDQERSDEEGEGDD
jgi:hypothetical protein